MSLWLVSAAVLIALLVPLAAVAAFGTPDDGLVALELASVLVTVALLLMAEGLGRQIFGDLALVLAVGAFAGSLAYAVLLERAS
ncbi:MAG TPA: monovalent cation/H+ antiporter complex subunit F [Solirubrobacteraceae bacterium]